MTDLSSWALGQLYPELASALPGIARRQPFVLGVSFLDLSNLCTPGDRRVSMTLTLTGPRLPFLVQGVYVAERRQNEAATLSAKLRVRFGASKFSVATPPSLHARPAAPKTPLDPQRVPRELGPLLPVIHALTRAPFHLLPALLAGTLHASLWTHCRELVDKAPVQRK